MSKVATDARDLHDRLTKKFVAARCRNDSSGSIHNPQADVSVMMAYMFEHIEAAFRQNAWPELIDFMVEKVGDDKNVFVGEQVRQVHLLVGEYVKSAYVPTEEQKTHMTFEQTLNSMGWHEQPVGARITYLYMVGLFHLSRCWVIGRQSNELGLLPDQSFESIATAAGVELRMFDQQINPTTEAVNSLRDAVAYAQQLGLSRKEICEEVELATKDPSFALRAAKLVKSTAIKLYQQVSPPKES